MIENNVAAVESYLTNLQERLCVAFQKQEKKSKFREDEWRRDGGGGGRTRVLTGTVFDQVGVNFSRVHGDCLPVAAAAQRPSLEGKEFRALGVSVVVHPSNPFVPASHCNIRFFQAGNGDRTVWWFGGGFDLTPCYPFEEDAVAWHRAASNICKPFGDGVYADHKAWCDRYFFLKHRNEMRGIGGLFFDDLNEWGFDRCFDYIRAVGEGYLDAYLPIVEKRKLAEFGETEKEFQLYRRGRYVEFNLLYDRGTLFGLQSCGRTESILMSLPPRARWAYDWQPRPNSAEARLTEVFLQPRQWV